MFNLLREITKFYFQLLLVSCTLVHSPIFFPIQYSQLNVSLMFYSFYARDSGLLKFRIWAGSPGRSAPPAARRLVAFTFHPTEPFGISVQRTNSDYVVNFHMRFPK